jgi:RNA polymerase sigma-70 factor (ECF subfamily)
MDADVFGRFAGGDLEAFETLFRQFQHEVFGWIACTVRDPAAAEDLTLETFWRIYRARARFDPARNFGAWARRIATNLALDYLKAGRREKRVPAVPPEDCAAATVPDSVAQEQTRAAIRRAFGQLPAKLQAVASLALIEQKPHAEIAEALGISVGAVKSREFRAVRLLREKLKRMGVEP